MHKCVHRAHLISFHITHHTSTQAQAQAFSHFVDRRLHTTTLTMSAQTRSSSSSSNNTVPALDPNALQSSALSPHPPASLATLPPELQRGVLGFLPVEELPPLRSLSKELGTAAALGIRSLQVVEDDFARTCYDAYATPSLLE